MRFSIRYIKNAGGRKFYRFRMSQICLCGIPVGGNFTKEGLCFECSFCHYFCTEQDAFIYDQGVKKFLATKQDRPRCCMNEGLMRNYARMRVVTDMKKENFGRPFFVCSKKHKPCRYFAWGDISIIPRPLCEHEKPCNIQKEWKEGPNKGRYFFSCAERSSCKFFKWVETEDQRKIVKDICDEF